MNAEASYPTLMHAVVNDMSTSSRRRWLALFGRSAADRIPTDYQATPEVTARLMQ
jgi:hypothetical protein